MNSAHLYRSIQIIWIHLRYKEIKKSKTVNFYCIVDYAHWGHHVKKKTRPYCSTSVVVWKSIKSTKIKEILDLYQGDLHLTLDRLVSARCNYETIDLTKKKHKKQKM
jgi:hypothetical protein